MSINCSNFFNKLIEEKKDSVKTIAITNNFAGFSTLIFAILLLLKAGIGNTVATEWSWWWITCPLWGPFALVLSFFLLAILIFLVGFLVIALTKFCIYLYKKFLNGK